MCLTCELNTGPLYLPTKDPSTRGTWVGFKNIDGTEKRKSLSLPRAELRTSISTLIEIAEERQ
jgi:hypothetical protein